MTQNNISDTFAEALDDLSDKHLEALREAFQSSAILNPGRLLRQMHLDILDEIRYRSGDGLE